MDLTRRTFAGFMVVSAASVAAGLAGCGSSEPAATDEPADDQAQDAQAPAEDGAAQANAADLIVVGGGAAGLAGAAKAAQGGASVIVLEGGGNVGGTTAIAGGHWKFMDDELLALLPERTEESDENLRTLLDVTAAEVGEYADDLATLQADIEAYLASDATQEFDSLEMWMIQHYLGTTGPELDPNDDVVPPARELIYPAYSNSAAIKDWLKEGGMEFEAFGSNFGDAGGPFSVNPTAPKAQGMAFITILKQFAEDAGAQIVTGQQVTALVEDGGAIVGVQTADGTAYSANVAVLLAAGGYGANADRVASDDERWTVEPGLGNCEPETNDGAALAAAEAIGAATANLGFHQYQTFPYHGAATIETTIPVVAAATFAVNQEGVRFTNDMFMFGTQSTDRSLGQTDTAYYLIGDSQTAMMLGDVQDRYVGTGDLVIADTIEECAEAHGLPADTVAAEVAKFNGYVDAGEDPDFGRPIIPADAGENATRKVEAAPFWIMSMKEYVQHTMGGVCIDPTGHVVDEDGAPIEGLFAAGEVVGNLDGAQRRHGDNMAQIMYYGCLAGDTVAAAV